MLLRHWYRVLMHRMHVVTDAVSSSTLTNPVWCPIFNRCNDTQSWSVSLGSRPSCVARSFLCNSCLWMIVVCNSVPDEMRVSHTTRICHVYIALLLKAQLPDISFDALSIDCQPFFTGPRECLFNVFLLRCVIGVMSLWTTCSSWYAADGDHGFISDCHNGGWTSADTRMSQGRSSVHIVSVYRSVDTSCCSIIKWRDTSELSGNVLYKLVAYRFTIKDSRTWKLLWQTFCPCNGRHMSCDDVKTRVLWLSFASRFVCWSAW